MIEGFLEALRLNSSDQNQILDQHAFQSQQKRGVLIRQGAEAFDSLNEEHIAAIASIQEYNAGYQQLAGSHEFVNGVMLDVVGKVKADMTAAYRSLHARRNKSAEEAAKANILEAAVKALDYAQDLFEHTHIQLHEFLRTATTVVAAAKKPEVEGNYQKLSWLQEDFSDKNKFGKLGIILQEICAIILSAFPFFEKKSRYYRDKVDEKSNRMGLARSMKTHVEHVNLFYNYEQRGKPGSTGAPGKKSTRSRGRG